MRSPPARLAWLLTAVLLWQSATAAAHCLRAAAASAVIEICGADGMRSMPLAPDRAPHAGGACAVCHLLPALALAAPEAVPVPVLWPALTPEVPVVASPWRPGARAPPYPPTGPPSLL